MTENRRPDFAAYVVRDRDDKKANWRVRCQPQRCCRGGWRLMR